MKLLRFFGLKLQHPYFEVKLLLYKHQNCKSKSINGNRQLHFENGSHKFTNKLFSFGTLTYPITWVIASGLGRNNGLFLSLYVVCPVEINFSFNTANHVSSLFQEVLTFNGRKKSLKIYANFIIDSKDLIRKCHICNLLGKNSLKRTSSTTLRAEKNKIDENQHSSKDVQFFSLHFALELLNYL